MLADGRSFGFLIKNEYNTILISSDVPSKAQSDEIFEFRCTLIRDSRHTIRVCESVDEWSEIRELT